MTGDVFLDMQKIGFCRKIRKKSVKITTMSFVYLDYKKGKKYIQYLIYLKIIQVFEIFLADLYLDNYMFVDLSIYLFM